MYVSELVLSTSGKSTAMTILAIGKKLQDLGDRVTSTNTDSYSNADSGLPASDKEDGYHSSIVSTPLMSSFYV